MKKVQNPAFSIVIFHLCCMKASLAPSWRAALEDELNAPYFERLESLVEEAYSEGECFPSKSEIFRAFDLCALDEVKVVILGQDPYIQKGQANGLAFSVQEGIPFPPSLRNIHRELSESKALSGKFTGDLSTWARQGVLLLNACLTVRAGESNSHQHFPWDRFTDAVIRLLNEEKRSKVFLLWGSFAQKKAKEVAEKRHLVLKAPHPSPLSAYRGFFSCNHFNLANDYLVQQNQTPIQW